MSAIRVFLLDDHELVRRGIFDLLHRRTELYVVGESGTAVGVARRIAELNTDVALLDCVLPDGSGIDVCREVRSLRPETKVLMLTSFDDEDALVAAAVAGASGYLLKQLRGQDLVAAISRVAGGESLLDPVLTARALDRVRDRHIDPAERGVFDLIAEGLTNREISDRLKATESAIQREIGTLMERLGLYLGEHSELRAAPGAPPELRSPSED